MQGSASVGAFMTAVAIEKPYGSAKRNPGSSAELKTDVRSSTHLPKAEANKAMTPETVDLDHLEKTRRED